MQRHDLYKRGRSYPVTCLSFGKNRKVEYPDCFFCHVCDLLEDAVENGSKRANRQQKKYTCTGGHSNLACPTTLKRQFRPKNVAVPASSNLNTVTAAVQTRNSMPSPIKKKQRREYEEDAVLSVESEEGEEDGPGCPETTTSCVTPASSGSCNECFFVRRSSENGSLMEYVNSLEAKTVWLEKQLAEALDSSQVNLSSTVETLTSQMEDLQFQQQSTSTAAGDQGQGDGYCDNHEGLGDSSHHARRKRRVQEENEELSRRLALLIDDFVTSSSFDDRRKFPTSRIAKIVVDSILSFEWIHSEFAKYASRQAAHVGDGADTNVSVALTSLLNVVTMKRHCDKSKAALLVDCMWDDDFLDGEVKEFMVNKVRSYLRSQIFTPYKILKAMDIAGFNLSLSGLEVLRRVDVGEGKYMRGILPSKATMVRTARKLG